MFPGSPSGKEPTYQCRRQEKWGFNPWVGKIPWRRAWKPTAVFLPGESHGQRSLESYCPLGRKELDMTEATQTLACSRFRLWIFLLVNNVMITFSIINLSIEQAFTFYCVMNCARPMLSNKASATLYIACEHLKSASPKWAELYYKCEINTKF